MREDPVSGRPKFSGTAAGLVYYHSGVGRLPIPAGDNAIDLLYHRAPQPVQVLLRFVSGDSHGLCYGVNVSASSADLNPNHRRHVIILRLLHPAYPQII